ncbi:hypothetical protein D3C76_1009600 [compost metagenome]
MPCAQIEPPIGPLQIHLPKLFARADFFFIQIAKCRCRLHETQLECLLVIVGGSGIGHDDALAKVVLLAEVEEGDRAALHGCHAQQLARELMIGHPVFAVEPEPTQVRQGGYVAGQCLAPQISVHLLQARSLVQACDQCELLPHHCRLCRQTNASIKAL